VTRNDLRKRLREHPVIPFRLVVSEGARYDIRHPEQLMVARDMAVVGLETSSETDDFYETVALVDLFHVVRLEPITPRPAPTQTGS
jgi:hypothetical protein